MAGWAVLIIIALAFVVGVAMKFYVGRGADMPQAELLERIRGKSDICILDVRSAPEYSSGHIPGAINMSHKEVSARLGELDSHRAGDIVVYCEMGVRARMAQKTLAKAGFERVYHLVGDMAGWRNAGFPTEMTPGRTAE